MNMVGRYAWEMAFAAYSDFVEKEKCSKVVTFKVPRRYAFNNSLTILTKWSFCQSWSHLPFGFREDSHDESLPLDDVSSNDCFKLHRAPSTSLLFWSLRCIYREFIQSSFASNRICLIRHLVWALRAVKFSFRLFFFVETERPNNSIDFGFCFWFLRFCSLLCV